MNSSHKLFGSKPLLDKYGVLLREGWSDSHIFEYTPSAVKYNKIHLKERDCYLLISSSGEYAVSFSVSDNRTLGLVSCCVYDFRSLEKFDCTEKKLFPMGSMKLPTSPESGNIEFLSKACNYHIDTKNGGKHIYCKYGITLSHTELTADISLSPPENGVFDIAAQGSSKGSFYYSSRIPCMRASGYVKVKGKTYSFDSSNDYAFLDWTRGQWVSDTAKFWGVGCGCAGGKLFGYNIGNSTNDGDLSENVIFYGGSCHKIGIVDFGIPQQNVMQPWVMSSDDNRWNMVFAPFFNDRTDISHGSCSQHGDKLFGMLNGTAVLDSGDVVEVNDMPVFHERVYYKW